LFHGDFIILYWESAMIHTMFQKYDVMKHNPYWLVYHGLSRRHIPMEERFDARLVFVYKHSGS